MSAEIHFVCNDCGCLSDEEAWGWRAEIVYAEERSDEELVFFCPDCPGED
ncbi:MAG TPA: hypothetical protein VH416_03840 [Gaiellaceae bacterium]